MSYKPLSAISTFSGIGGLDLGLECAGFDLLTCIESDTLAQQSLKANRPNWAVFGSGRIEDAAAELVPGQFDLEPGDLGLLAGAPPCQPYSKAAMWRREAWNGFDDERAKPLLPFLDLVDRFLPRAVLIENVQGFVSGPRSAVSVLERGLEQVSKRHDCGYRLDWRVLNAADYGVPQNRRRAILVALRDDAEMIWPEPTHAEDPICAWDAIGQQFAGEDPPVATGRWADLLASIPEGENYLFHTPEGRGLPIFGYRTRYWSFLLKLARDRPSWTLPAQPGPSTGPFHWDNRPLSTSELLRLQSIPPDWQVVGSRREQVRQIGNATPALLGEVLGRAVRSSLDGETWSDSPTLMLDRQPSAPAATPPSPVPEEFRVLVGDKPAHPGVGLGPRPRHDTSASR